jgi:uncharacterized protein YceK
MRGAASLLALTLLASGCASSVLRVSWPTESSAHSRIGTETVQIPAEALPYYAGTTFDFVCALGPLFGYGAAPGGSVHGGEESGWIGLAPFCLVDLPLSAALDTILLPVDYLSHRRCDHAMTVYNARMTELRRNAANAGATDGRKSEPLGQPGTTPTVIPPRTE